MEIHENIIFLNTNSRSTFESARGPQSLISSNPLDKCIAIMLLGNSVLFSFPAEV